MNSLLNFSLKFMSKSTALSQNFTKWCSREEGGEKIVRLRGICLVSYSQYVNCVTVLNTLLQFPKPSSARQPSTVSQSLTSALSRERVPKHYGCHDVCFDNIRIAYGLRRCGHGVSFMCQALFVLTVPSRSAHLSSSVSWGVDVAVD